MERDGTCVVTSSAWALVQSHLIPKRMGADGVKCELVGGLERRRPVTFTGSTQLLGSVSIAI